MIEYHKIMHGEVTVGFIGSDAFKPASFIQDHWDQEFITLIPIVNSEGNGLAIVCRIKDQDYELMMMGFEQYCLGAPVEKFMLKIYNEQYIDGTQGFKLSIRRDDANEDFTMIDTRKSNIEIQDRVILNTFGKPMINIIGNQQGRAWLYRSTNYLTYPFVKQEITDKWADISSLLRGTTEEWSISADDTYSKPLINYVGKAESNSYYISR